MNLIKDSYIQSMKLCMFPGPFKCLVVREQQARKEVSLLARIINPDHHGEERLFLYGGQKNTLGFQVSLEDTFGYTLASFDDMCTSGAVMV